MVLAGVSGRASSPVAGVSGVEVGEEDGGCVGGRVGVVAAPDEVDGDGGGVAGGAVGDAVAAVLGGGG